VRRAAGADVHPTAFVHESSYVDAGARVGARTKVWHFCHLMPGCEVGERLLARAERGGDGRRARRRQREDPEQRLLYEGVELEDDVFCGPSMVFTNVLNPRSHVSRKHEYRRTLVRRGASIGANATVVCGHTLGEYAFVGAGAVVTRDVPDYALVAGVPGAAASAGCARAASSCRARGGARRGGWRVACPRAAPRYLLAGDRLRPAAGADA
jgi:UDP-2-acetamido-3-amino-2,3-dideoxy-glucuronate N-acetyltransferase